MTKKAGAGIVVLWLGTLTILSLVWGAAAQEEAPADPVQEEARHLSERLDAREAELAGLGVDELREKAQEVMEAIKERALESQDLQGRLFEVRNQAREHETIRAIQAEINAMRQRLEEAIDELPEVKHVIDSLEESKGELFELMQFRTRIQRLIAAAEYRDDPPPRALTDGDETIE